jgi:putative restriction endonuclease
LVSREKDEQRLDVHNGLLLSALWDAAFDSGLISFSADGSLLTSPRLEIAARRHLEVSTARKLALREEHQFYLTFHRENIWIRD